MFESFFVQSTWLIFDTCIPNIQDIELFDLLSSQHLSVLSTPKIELNCYLHYAQIIEKIWVNTDVDVNQLCGKEETLLYIACFLGHLEIVKKILTYSVVDVNKGVSTGETPFYVACDKGYEDIVQALLEHPDIDINQGSRLFTPLCVAYKQNHLSIVEKLLKRPEVKLEEIAYHELKELVPDDSSTDPFILWSSPEAFYSTEEILRL